MTEDSQLLTRFVRDSDQVAFRAWVDHRLPLVYSAAMRILNGDQHLAEDVAQQVFNDAASQAKRLSTHPSPAGWLFTSTRFAATKILRAQIRRQQREIIATMDPSLNNESLDWNTVRPVIDEALAALPDSDREAVIRRYFDQADYDSIGEQLNLSANTARMRVDRALVKLSDQLRRRGIHSTAGALGITLSANSVLAAPIGLASTIASAATAGSATTLVQLFAMSKAPLITTAIVLAVGSTSIAVQRYHYTSPDQPIATEKSLPGPAIHPPRSSVSTPAEITVSDNLTQKTEALREELQQLDAAIAARLRRLPPHGPLYPVSQVTTKPKPTEQVRPKYPEDLREAGITGNALIEFTVDKSGRVLDFQSIEASRVEFAEAALEAISKWEFEPGELPTGPVNTRMQIPMNFTISKPITPKPDVWF